MTVTAEHATRVARRSDAQLAHTLTQKLDAIWRSGDRDECSIKHIGIRVSRIAHGQDDWADQELDYRTPWSSVAYWSTDDDLTAWGVTPGPGWTTRTLRGRWTFHQSPFQAYLEARQCLQLADRWASIIDLRDIIGPDRFHAVLARTQYWLAPGAACDPACLDTLA